MLIWKRKSGYAIQPRIRGLHVTTDIIEEFFMEQLRFDEIATKNHQLIV